MEEAAESTDGEEKLDAEPLQAPVVIRPGDIMVLGDHRLIVGDARGDVSVDALLARERADAAFLDPPCNVLASSIGGHGRYSHPDFAFASGEMSESGPVAFLTASLQAVAKRCWPGAVVFVRMDWKHAGELIAAGRAVFDAYLNLIVWNTTNADQGGLYRNEHELIGVFRVGEPPRQQRASQAAATRRDLLRGRITPEGLDVPDGGVRNPQEDEADRQIESAELMSVPNIILLPKPPGSWQGPRRASWLETPSLRRSRA